MKAVKRLDEIEGRAAKATSGPWTRWKHPLGTKTMDFVSAPSLRGDGLPFSVADDLLGRDAEFVAHSREDVDWLVKQLRAIDAVITEQATAGYSDSGALGLIVHILTDGA